MTKASFLRKTIFSSFFTTIFLFTASVSAFNPTPALGVQSDAIGTINGWSTWIGWNASFSESYAPTSETYNWIVFFAPEGIFAGLTSAESDITSIDVFAGIGAFAGMYAAPQGDQLSWNDFTKLTGYTITKGFDIIPSPPFGPLANGSLSVSIGPTFFHTGNAADFVRAYQFNVSIAASISLLEIPFVPSIALDSRSNLTNEDTGFWPILLWDMNVDPNLSPIENIVVKLVEMIVLEYSGQDESIIALAMIQRLLPIMQSLQSNAERFGEAVSLGAHIDEFLENNSTTQISNPAAGSIDYLIAAAQNWVAQSDENAPAQIMAEMPIDLAEIYQNLRPVKQAVTASFELAYRNGYERAVEDEEREDNIIYSDCVATQYCTSGEECTITVDASEIAAHFSGTTAEEFNGAYVWFDVPTESYLSSGTAGGETEIQIENGQASYTFIQTASYPLILGVVVDRDFANDLTDGKNIELCHRQVVFVSPLAENQVSVEDGTLTSIASISPEALPESEDIPEDMWMGLVEIEIDSEPNATVTIELNLPSSAPEGYSWFKRNSNNEWIDLINTPQSNGDHAEFTNDRNTVIMTITDNGPLDSDPSLGHIIDPCGLGLITENFPQNSSSNLNSSSNSNRSSGGCSTNTSAKNVNWLSLFLFAFFIRRKRENVR